MKSLLEQLKDHLAKYGAMPVLVINTKASLRIVDKDDTNFCYASYKWNLNASYEEELKRNALLIKNYTNTNKIKFIHDLKTKAKIRFLANNPSDPSYYYSNERFVSIFNRPFVLIKDNMLYCLNQPLNHFCKKDANITLHKLLAHKKFSFPFYLEDEFFNDAELFFYVSKYSDIDKTSYYEIESKIIKTMNNEDLKNKIRNFTDDFYTIKKNMDDRDFRYDLENILSSLHTNNDSKDEIIFIQHPFKYVKIYINDDGVFDIGPNGAYRFEYLDVLDNVKILLEYLAKNTWEIGNEKSFKAFLNKFKTFLTKNKQNLREKAVQWWEEEQIMQPIITASKQTDANQQTTENTNPKFKR